MIINQSADHAVRAVLYMARQPGQEAQPAETIAKAIGVPRNYLGKVLNALARAGVLTSTRGPHGGFRLALPPEQIPLVEVIAPFQAVSERRMCLLGDRACNPARPCDAHLQWQTMAVPVERFFHLMSVGELLGAQPV